MVTGMCKDSGTQDTCDYGQEAPSCALTTASFALTQCWRDLGDGEEEEEVFKRQGIKGENVLLKWPQTVPTAVYCSPLKGGDKCSWGTLPVCASCLHKLYLNSASIATSLKKKHYTDASSAERACEPTG